MNPRTSLTLANGKSVDLLAPAADDISFAVIAEHLSKINRYCGATARKAYSVAQHSVIGAEEIARETGDDTLTAYFLCHDMHEAYLGDDVTPKKRALGEICASFGALASTIETAFAEMTDRFDVAIHQAAGLAWPPSPQIAEGVKYWDRVMLATEWRDLMECQPPYVFGTPTLQRVIKPWGWRDADNAFLLSCRRWLPALQIAIIP